MNPEALRVVAQNVADLYAKPDAASERVSQAILGDRVIVTDERHDFSHVSMGDGYEGWIASPLLVPFHKDLDTLTTTIATLFADVYTAPDAHSEMLTKLVAASTIVLTPRAGVDDWVPVTLPNQHLGFIHRVSLNLSAQGISDSEMSALLKNHCKKSLIAALGRQVAETSKRFIGTPYLWGGCTPFGIDCSGLTQIAYKLNGIQLRRDAHQQWADRRFRRVEEGQTLETAILEDGDLVVFSRRDDKRPTHIGIALGDGRFLHSRGGQGVRIDECNSEEYGKTYLGAIRLSPDADFAIQST